MLLVQVSSACLLDGTQLFHSYSFLILLDQYVDETNKKGSGYKVESCHELQRNAFTFICGGCMLMIKKKARVDVGLDGAASQYCKASA